MVFYTFVDSPLGLLRLVSNGEALLELSMSQQLYRVAPQPGWQENPDLKIFKDAKIQLDEYFNGQRQIFDLVISHKGTVFQQAVWLALEEIPFGETVTYKELSIRIGRPSSIRAVGQANGHNPISIIVPCHRVVGSDGSLTGYGGGIHRKAALIDFEKTVKTTGPRKLVDMPAYDPSLLRQSSHTGQAGTPSPQ